MKMTDLQFAGITINISTLGQVDLSDNDREMLQTLEYLLEAALENVRRGIAAASEEPRDFVVEAHERIAHKNDDERPDWEA